MSDLRAELRAELDAAGVFAYQPVRTYVKAIVLACVTVALFAGMFLAGSWWVKAPLFVVGVAVSIGLMMIGHDAGHRAVGRSKWTNDALGYFLFSLAAGLPLVYWKWKHNTMHHSFPNVAGKDPDVEIYPYAMNKSQRVERGWQAFVQRHQSLLFWPIALPATQTMAWDGIWWQAKDRRAPPGPREGPDQEASRRADRVGRDTDRVPARRARGAADRDDERRLSRRGHLGRIDGQGRPDVGQIVEVVPERLVPEFSRLARPSRRATAGAPAASSGKPCAHDHRRCNKR